jgi:glycosyltransferase involved in cell wall biosynthesis
MTVVTIGRLDTQKGLPVLIRAISLVPEIRLKIVGDGPLRPELESLVSSMRLGERVSFLGIRSNVADILGAADAYAQSSEWEGFGLAAVEAMSSGLPLIISDVPGLRDVAADAGLRFPPGNHVELAKHLARLSVDADLQQRLRKMSLARAKNFSIEKTTDEYLHVYRRVSRPESTFSSCSASAA